MFTNFVFTIWASISSLKPFFDTLSMESMKTRKDHVFFCKIILTHTDST